MWPRSPYSETLEPTVVPPLNHSLTWGSLDLHLHRSMAEEPEDLDSTVEPHELLEGNVDDLPPFELPRAEAGHQLLVVSELVTDRAFVASRVQSIHDPAYSVSETGRDELQAISSRPPPPGRTDGRRLPTRAGIPEASLAC